MQSIFSNLFSVFHVKYVCKREFSTKKLLVDQAISQKAILMLNCFPLSELLYIRAFGNPLFCIGVCHKARCSSFGCCIQGCRLLQKSGGGGNTNRLSIAASILYLCLQNLGGRVPRPPRWLRPWLLDGGFASPLQHQSVREDLMLLSRSGW